MRFEYDPDRSQSNKEKHGIDFQEAQALWADLDLVEIRARIDDERRYMVIEKTSISIGQRSSPIVVTRSGLSLCVDRAERR